MSTVNRQLTMPGRFKKIQNKNGFNGNHKWPTVLGVGQVIDH